MTVSAGISAAPQNSHCDSPSHAVGNGSLSGVVRQNGIRTGPLLVD